MKLLWLLPYRPWPQDHGGKIRVHAVLAGLAGAGGVEIDAWYPKDPGVTPTAGPVLAGLTWHEYQARLGAARASKALALATPLPVQVRAVTSAEVRRRVTATARDYDAVVLDQIYQYPLVRDLPRSTPLVVVAHNIEHRLAEQLGRSAPRRETRAVFRVDAAKFRRLEQAAFSRADLVIAVSEEDAEVVRSMCSTPVTVRPNGVDPETFSFAQPRAGRVDRLLMTGMLGYPPNHEAAIRIREEILPRVRASVPAAQVDIVGSRCPPGLAAMNDPASGFNVVGYVDEILPSHRSADVFLMPLTMGGGTRLKALQAMAVGTPVVSTPQGVEGLRVVDGEHVRIGETSEELARHCVDLLEDDVARRRQATAARRLVETDYAWAQVVDGVRQDLASVIRRRA